MRCTFVDGFIHVHTTFLQYIPTLEARTSCCRCIEGPKITRQSLDVYARGKCTCIRDNARRTIATMERRLKTTTSTATMMIAAKTPTTTTAATSTQPQWLRQRKTKTSRVDSHKNRVNRQFAVAQIRKTWKFPLSFFKRRRRR